MLKPPDLDPRAVARQFARRAGRPGDADFLLREVGHRMLERLGLGRIEPQGLLDVGCGSGQGVAALMQRFPRARALGADLSPAMAATARGLHRRTGSIARRLQRVLSFSAAAPAEALFCAADAARLPLAPASVDLLWSNLAWHWLVDPPAVAAEWYRVIRPQGLLMFSSFGVDTLRELRAIGAPLPEFPDLHDIGDLLGQVGFAQPVLDTERLSVTWREPQRLLADLHRLGGNALRGRRRGLTPRSAQRRWLAALEALRRPDGLIEVSFEIVHAHAWCPQRKRNTDGSIPIEWLASRRRIG